ncbi:bifunctional hydroxymethylpyrimidine kinase/phosphomethylpyrimidine kinase [Candidatus Hecatella orcuttiae]|jgi:hydroxymethylpyrimidine/phosphomethylpyrimidine kinase|uniref:bifunctional hydroxymethylpyrimidine kinase/phosphomethylpyrimidine kinase n=1 Tax=Candidatus Hecatella orcuttiae TaxID=1935119 RepID=UPI0028680D24|nr:bifunctional hydroxymethylpyrimidine kinase/phosphomethylpyrimidine kinase [Candidatus Hecatella orcuttiae]
MRPERKLPVALTIAGVDSCGGAGVAADLKTFSALGVHGACAVTALTAQNTRSVAEISPVEPRFLEKQLETLLADLKVNAFKTGMLPSRETVECVSDFMEDGRLKKAVVDPVFKATTGRRLSAEDAVEAYARRLLPQATLATPNLWEAEKLSGVRIKSLRELKKAARKISDLGVKGVVIKGGHLRGGKAVDLLYWKGEFAVYPKPRLPVSLHGGGCVFSAALTALLAKGLEPWKAVEEVEAYIHPLFQFGLQVGSGLKVVNPLIPLYNEAEKAAVAGNVDEARWRIVKDKRFHPFIAQVGSQVAMALPYPTSTNHVAAVEGRIRREGGEIKASGPVRFGVSTHMARLILAATQLGSSKRAALNLHYHRRLLQALKKAGMKTRSFNRRKEPGPVKKVEGSTLPWGLRTAALRAGEVPDVLYDLGEKGREPMIRVLGETAVEAVEKASRALEFL